ncbi:MAG: hypothetical protein KGJ43_09565, partial [Acidobacteriota bacterium]|nr:hypothetical protein [Acidobacteriota bacterium]
VDVLASAPFTIASGARGAVTLELSGLALHLIARARDHRLHVRALAVLSGGTATARTITLGLPRPSKSRRGRRH